MHASRLGPRSVFCTRLRVTPLTSGTVRELAKPLGGSACEPLARYVGANRRCLSGPRLHDADA